MTASHDSEIDPAPDVLEQMRRMAYDRSKWLQTCTYVISQFQFDVVELFQFYDDLQAVIHKVRKYLKCPICKYVVKKVGFLSCLTKIILYYIILYYIIFCICRSERVPVCFFMYAI